MSTHLWKTPEIRLKQGLFHAWNAGRAVARGRAVEAARMLGRAVDFALTPADFCSFCLIRELEERAGRRSFLHLYGGPPGWQRRTPARLLLDPCYDVAMPDIANTLRAMAEHGWTIGLHQSSAGWRDANVMRNERDRVAQSVGVPVHACRQHWLRFSWAETWKAQEQAGLTLNLHSGSVTARAFVSGRRYAIILGALKRRLQCASNDDPCCSWTRISMIMHR